MSMDSINNKIKDAYKQCASVGCTRNGTNHLGIIFLHKKGWFCQSCATDLLRLGLIDKERNQLDL